jgi:predicted ATPase/Tfp pilus assembly protein PilF
MEDLVRAPSSSDFGTLLRHHRLAAGLSQEALAERARMSTNGISALERGYRRSPQRETLGLLAGALALSDEQRRAFEAAAASAASRITAKPPVAVGPWPGAGLPLALTSFVGRDAELKEIAELTRDYRLITLTGSGGVGKTQTALRVGAALGEESDTAVRFVGLAAVRAGLVTAAVAAAVGIQELPDHPLFETLGASLKNKAMLLILDNCEHVISEAATVADTLLGACSQLRILATSREPLRTAGERTYRLPSLEEAPALALFADRARAVDHRFAITDDNEETLRDLCRRLDGIPLAIELAAARINLLSVRALTERLDERFRILSGGERTALPRQQTMHATIDWSYNLLTPSEQRLFERLAVFVDGCTLDGAEAVAAGSGLDAHEVFDLLSSLAEKSLVVADVELNTSRYRLLESTRAFALEKLSERDERSELVHRHALWAAGVADRVRQTARTMPVVPWLREFEPELDNARSAMEGALSAADLPVAMRIAAGFSLIWSTSRGQAEPRRWLEAVLPHLDEEPDPVVASHVWRVRSWLTFGSHKIEAAQRALELDEASGDVFGQVWSLYQITAGLLETRRFEEAERISDRALKLYHDHDLTRTRRYAWALDVAARLAVHHGRIDEARHSYAQALAVMIAFGDEFDATAIRQNMGELEFSVGNFQQALEHVETALAAARRVHSLHREISALTTSAACRLALGDADGARLTASEALTLAQDAQPLEAAVAIQHLATVASMQGDTRRGARLRGYVDNWYRREGCERDITERRTYEILTESVNAALGESELGVLAAEGAQLSKEQATAEALAV